MSLRLSPGQYVHPPVLAVPHDGLGDVCPASHVQQVGPGCLVAGLVRLDAVSEHGLRLSYRRLRVIVGASGVVHVFHILLTIIA